MPSLPCLVLQPTLDKIIGVKTKARCNTQTWAQCTMVILCQKLCFSLSCHRKGKKGWLSMRKLRDPKAKFYYHKYGTSKGWNHYKIKSLICLDATNNTKFSSHVSIRTWSRAAPSHKIQINNVENWYEVSTNTTGQSQCSRFPIGWKWPLSCW